MAVLAILAAGPLQAAPFDGTFVAQQDCPALQSIRNGSNPGNQQVKAGQSYTVLEVNNLGQPTHYRVRVPGASPAERWVSLDCGIRTGLGQEPRTQTKADTPKPAEAPAASYVLAASWQPGFCETQPEKVECLDQGRDRFDATHFALHGLWPQPRSLEYCGVSGELQDADRPATWRDLPEIQLEASTRAELTKVMPGTASFLDRHEWLVHGTCYKEDMQSYFSESLALMAQLNASSLRTFMTENIGKAVTPARIRAAVDEAFGEGAGERVSIECKTEQDGNRVVLTELQIRLYGAIDETSDLGELIRTARPQDSNAGQCPRIIIDKAGL